MRNTNKVAIIMIAVVTIGIFALPNVISIGTGQHTFNNGSAVNCNKCHANPGDRINTELLASGTTMYNILGSPVGSKIHALDGTGLVGQCSSCHYLAAGPRTTDHTGVTLTPVCTGCHSNVLSELSNATEPHSRFSTQGNAGCIGCHTAVTVSGSPSYSYSAPVTSLGMTIGNGIGP